MDTLTTIDPAAISDDWEDLTSAGRELTEQNDRNRWALGDLAGRCTARYGEDSLTDFASDIRIFYQTVYSYRQVSAFYPSSTRIEFPALSWSHYRMCVRLGDLGAALQMLGQASDLNWSARDLTDAINVTLGKPPVNRPLLVQTVVAEGGALAVVDDLLERDVTYLVKVYRAEGTP